jgi:hypothetical protein
MTFRPYNQLTASGLSDQRTNNTGVTMPKGTPARINVLGELDFIDVSVEAEALAGVGVTAQSIPNAAQGTFLSSGKIEDITTTAAFGDLVYVDKTGAISNTKPSIGVGGFVAGDFVIQVGVIAKNESNPTLKDLIISVAIVGQL